MFPCPTPSAVSLASAFCATVTAGGVTATNYPTRATAACGTTPDRYVSACQCGPTCSGFATSTSKASSCTAEPTGSALLYGDFECGTPDPFAVQIRYSSFVTSVDSPGFTGKYAFTTRYNGSSTCGVNTCTNARIVGPALPVTPGVDYKLTFATFFASGGAGGFIGLPLDDRGPTIDAFDFPQDQWHLTQWPWDARAGETSLQVIFEWLGPASRLDSITFAPVSAYCGPSPPQGIMPDGEFECGLGAWSQQVQSAVVTAGVASTTAINTGAGAIGQFAWQATASAAVGLGALLVSPAVAVVPGVTYIVAFRIYFASAGVGSVAVLVNGVSLFTASTNNDPGYFIPYQFFWRASSTTATATVTF